MRERLKY
jgi:hypothetical protein